MIGDSLLKNNSKLLLFQLLISTISNYFISIFTALLSGYVKVYVHDEAYIRLHLGMVGVNVDILSAGICFKGETSYNVNILQVIS